LQNGNRAKRKVPNSKVASSSSFKPTLILAYSETESSSATASGFA